MALAEWEKYHLRLDEILAQFQEAAMEYHTLTVSGANTATVGIAGANTGANTVGDPALFMWKQAHVPPEMRPWTSTDIRILAEASEPEPEPEPDVPLVELPQRRAITLGQ